MNENTKTSLILVLLGLPVTALFIWAAIHFGAPLFRPSDDWRIESYRDGKFEITHQSLRYTVEPIIKDSSLFKYMGESLPTCTETHGFYCLYSSSDTMSYYGSAPAKGDVEFFYVISIEPVGGGR